MQELETEYAGAVFGDVRLEARLRGLGRKMGDRPGESFPAVLDGAELEGAYRFVNNERVTMAKVLEPHIRATLSRVGEHQTVVIAHDASSFRFEGAGRRDLGRLLQKGQGFFGHVAMAITSDDKRDPLGVVGVTTRVRSDKRRDKKSKVRAKDREFLRWTELVDEAGGRLRGVSQAIHVMDREADCFELFEHMISKGHRFVVRLTHDRRLFGKGMVSDALEHAPVVATRDVELSARVGHSAPSTRRIHPPRAERSAKLAMSTARVALRNPEPNGHSSLVVHVVRVVEIDAPPDCTPVEWRLVTTEPIGSSDQVLAIVDAYRARWRIEEFFKALKSGCCIEKRQLESLHALLNAMALFIPIAWQLLRLRVLARQDAPASLALTTEQLEVLRAANPKACLPSNPSAREVLLAIARLGGHLVRNGDPGWMILARGYQDLLALQRGWALARGLEHAGSDQS
jgi:hypothetical protein